MSSARLLAETDQLIQRGRLRDAERILQRSLKTSPHDVAVLNQLALVQAQLGSLDSAISAWRQITRLAPQDTNALTNLGTALRLQGHLEEALAYLESAARQRSSAITLNNLGLVKLDLQRFADAHKDFLAALALDNSYPEALNNLGTALIKLQRFEEALRPLSAAIEIRPNYAKALTNRAAALLELNRIEDAYADVIRSFAIDPNQDFLAGLVLHTGMQQCRWENLPQLLAHLQHGLRERRKVAAGFALIGAVDDPEMLRVATEIWTTSQAPLPAATSATTTAPRRVGVNKIRLGYFSADFHNHATAHLIAGLIEAQDRARFETIAYSFGPIRHDEMHARLSKAFDRFVEVGSLTDAAIAALAREDELDIAIDLKGYTQGSRSGIFAHRAAPVQINYLGYPGTMGAPFIDYLIADPFLIPADAESGFSEQIIRLPNSYQPNDNERPRPTVSPSRRELGLSENAFVFCSFNNNYKITPEVFETWMTILRAKPNSVLWLLEDNATAATNLRRAAQAAGVDAARLVFAPRVGVVDHLARHGAADLFLDTWPCNAHTTASDAIWMGLPLITLAQRSFASRVAGSLLSAVGLPELICHDRESYIRLALQLAEDPARLAALRAHLTGAPKQLPLFDTQRFCRHFETALAHAVNLSRSGAKPRHFSISVDGSAL
jgi:protein O-GlcNAc transferase